MKPTIVVIAFDRPLSLQRLLRSLHKAGYPPDVRLVISIDAGGEQTAVVHQLATDFEWPHGQKRIIQHETKMGLIGNVFFGGGLSQEYGPIILLEDDLYVSPAFYHYAAQALDFYGDDPRIAGISLNALWFNGYTHYPFIPYLDDSDVFFLQVAWFQGQAYTPAQWAAFAEWRQDQAGTAVSSSMHEIFATFPETDWFPLKTRYLVATNRFYVFPRQSLTTNFGDAGTHFEHTTSFFQTPLQTLRQHFRLRPLEESIAVYDSFQELLPDRLNRLTGKFIGYEYAVDLNGTKSPAKLTTEYVLTTKRGHAPLHTFGKLMWPLVANVVEDVPGSDIFFSKVSDLDAGWLSVLASEHSNHVYFTRGRRLSRKKRLRFWMAAQLRKLGLI